MNGLWVSPPDRDLPPGRLAERREHLVSEINRMERRTAGAKRRPARRLKRTMLAAGAILVLGASAAIAGAFRSGMLDAPPYAGDGWQLIVGEEANPDSGTWKVCHRWGPSDEPATDANGFGPAGCVNWPDDATDTIIMDAIAFTTPYGNETDLLFVDLTADAVDTVVVTLEDGSTIDTVPFVMPQSGKQFAVLELPAGVRAIEVRLLENGEVVESRTTISILEYDFGDQTGPGA